jgi:hypothetical protein
VVGLSDRVASFYRGSIVRVRSAHETTAAALAHDLSAPPSTPSAVLEVS